MSSSQSSNAKSNQQNENFAFESLEAIRNRLLDLTSRNRLLNYRYPRSGVVRVIDELPDQLASNMLDGATFTFIPVDEPTREGLIEHGFIGLNEEGQEVKLKPDPSAKEWALINGFNTDYQLPEFDDSDESKHNDNNIQSLLYPRELEAQLRNIRTKSNTAIEESGANILYLALGFLEWFEDDNSDVSRQAPLYLIPVKINKASLDKRVGCYTYTIEYTGEDIIPNLSLREKLKLDFNLGLPDLDEDMSPEQYFKEVNASIVSNKPKWKIKRFATLAMLDFGKLLMYLDLDPARWPDGNANIQNHPIVKQFFAAEGEISSDTSSLSVFGEEYEIDKLERLYDDYPLIYDADSSQHSALVDAIDEKNLVIEGPPGSGKSQSITNLIAAAIAQGKRVLFVAEKMAALNVVKDRLEKAGLGDFCLELHSHKTQKKKVYEDIDTRIKKQGEYQFPNNIELEIKIIEEKKERLSSYANLVNSMWKNTGCTIYDIFTTATRYREEFRDIPISDIQPDNLNGSTFDELSSRKTIDSLKRYAMVFNEIREQVGLEAKLDEHPWFGVFNQSLQMFDTDDVCQLLNDWQEGVTGIQSSLDPINHLLADFCVISSLPETRNIIADAERLPKSTGNENLESLKLLHSETLSDINGKVDLINRLHHEYHQLSKSVTASLLDDDNALQQSISSAKELKQLFSEPDTAVSQLNSVISQWTSLNELASSLNEDFETLIDQLPALEKSLVFSWEGLEAVRELMILLCELDPKLTTRRHVIFDEDAMDNLLPEMERLLSIVQPIHKSLSEAFDVESLPSSGELISMRKIFAEAGFFKWFSSDWRSARKTLLASATATKPNFKTLSSLLNDAIKYKKHRDEFESNQEFESVFQHEYKGVHTPFEDVARLRSWYKKVRELYGFGFGKNVVFASALFEMSNDVFKGFKHLFDSKTFSEVVRFTQLRRELKENLNVDVLSDNNAKLMGNDGLSAVLYSLKSKTDIVQSSIEHDMSLIDLESVLSNASIYRKAESGLVSDTKLHKAFQLDSPIQVRDIKTTQIAQILDTTELANQIEALTCEGLKHYLRDRFSKEAISQLSAWLEKLNVSYTEARSSFDLFSKKVELNFKIWSKADLEISSILERNQLALSHPMWLTTWVDFTRVRTVLSNEGLENLLSYTESGALDLDNIEFIYKYAVFDTLAREVIQERKELSHFSGADQNAIRAQFREYDEKLLELQRRKIAHKVSQEFHSTTEGVKSGKVSGYTEMGLIRNETGKKTRHLPLRQALKRAGKSLQALKPCFMMGPHSVAQYLAPGELEFDLIVMDEASQIKPEDALGTIARGKQIVIVGDPKQLPPTSFFDKTVANDEEDVTAIEQSESILDVAFPMFNARRLRWHYRSRHESLIAFSNQEFYHSDLIIFPSPDSESDEFGIKFTHVKQGRFVNQRNVEEAKVIAASVRNHLLHRSHESLGVVAMSAQQREQIERCVEELSKEDAAFRDVLAENGFTDEPLFLKNLENVQGDERDVIYISCTYGPQEPGAANMPQRFGPINSAAGGRRLNVLFTRSKKRMHIFSSMTEGHILAKDTSNPGVHALKNFLSYAQTGKLQQLTHTGKAPDNDFEIAVMDALKLEGFSCVPQVGVAGYFIDLAVQDPGQPGRYLMGIECDGATYHSAKSARDRDRLRQSVLEGLGWKIERIWSTDWFKNPQAQLKPIIAKLHQLKTEPKLEDQVSEQREIEDVIAHEEAVLHTIDAVTHQNLSLKDKLLAFDNEVIAGADEEVNPANKLLRPAMIDALCEFTPISKNEFLEFIPAYLRNGTSLKHGKYIEHVLNIIAEDEEELESEVESGNEML